MKNHICSGRWLFLAAALCTACAPVATSMRPAGNLVALSNVDSEPELLRCDGYVEPDRTIWTETQVVTVPLVVDSQGRVESVGIPRRQRNTADPGVLALTDETRERTIAIARDCEFEPAMNNGQPVSARYTLSLRFALRGF